MMDKLTSIICPLCDGVGTMPTFDPDRRPRIVNEPCRECGGQQRIPYVEGMTYERCRVVSVEDIRADKKDPQ